MCQNTNVSECSRVPKVQDIDNILRKMCQSHYLTISPPGLIFWEMLSSAFPLTSCNRYALFLLLLEYHANKTSCSIFCNRYTLFLLPPNHITQTKLSLSITWIWWWRWLPWPPGRPSPSSGTRCCFFVACPWLCQGTCMRVQEMSKYARVPGKCQIIALLWRRGPLKHFQLWMGMMWDGLIREASVYDDDLVELNWIKLTTHSTDLSLKTFFQILLCWILMLIPLPLKSTCQDLFLGADLTKLC